MTRTCCVLVLAVTILAIALRLPRLQQRPMHGDEAVHAIKFGKLLEEGVYTYDPDEYHGPTLNYLTLVPAWLTGAVNLAQVSEFTLRIVPVFFGACLILLLLLVARPLGTGATVYAAVLTAVSPAMVFYSRYYIQEILLVCFTFGAIASGFRYARNRSMGWALLTGVFLGLMHASKETCVIALGSMVLALLLTLLMQRRDGSLLTALRTVPRSHWAGGLVAGLIVSGLFHSSFLTNPGGILDSIRTYTTYLGRASGNAMHLHPWSYYLEMLIYFRYGDGPIWTEALIVLLAVVGLIAAMTRKGLSSANAPLVRFIAFYTIIMTVVYSAIPYKTPWCLLGFLHGMILLAGVGAVVLVRLVPNVLPRLIVLFLLFDTSVHLTWEACRASYTFDADSRNPYVYAHPTAEVFTIVRRIEQYAGAHKDGRNMPIEVICPGDDYWPLPWYLRAFKRVSWLNHVVEDTDSAPLIIASPEVEGALTRKLYTLTPLEKRQMYLFLFDKPYYMWLRPEVKLLGFVRRGLWDRLQRQQTDAAQAQTVGEK
ncbi:MAG: TIGR03663 family protein [Phycisphaerales bacterium]|nr:MAG: TIGR03663 family protein [Phycisphaerales bacterium]